MTLPVFWSPSVVSASPGDEVVLDGREGHHAVVVRRLTVGEELWLTDGAGTRVAGEVVATGRKDLTVRVRSVSRPARPEPRVTVVQAIPKGDRGELAVELMTEVGVDTVVPWAAERSVARWRGERAVKSLERWRSTAREAAKQSRRAWFPEITQPAGLDEVCARVAAARAAAVLHEADGTEGLPLGSLPVDRDVLLVVGPEGGVSDAELAALRSAGAAVVRLGDEVMRTSTAGAAATAALLARTPRWGVSAP